MRFASLTSLTAAALLAGCMGEGGDVAGTPSQAGLDKALAGLVPEAQTSCIPTLASNVSTTVYGKVLLYRVSNREVYRNDTAGGCDGGGDSILVQVEHGGRPCAGDIIHMVDRYSHIPTGACALGQFTPYRRPPK